MLVFFAGNAPKPLSPVSPSPITPRSALFPRNRPTEKGTTQPEISNPQTRRPRVLSDHNSYHRGRLKVPIKTARWSPSLASLFPTYRPFDCPNLRTTLRLVDRETICMSVAGLSHPFEPISVDLLRPGSGIPSITSLAPPSSPLHRPPKPFPTPDPSQRPSHC